MGETLTQQRRVREEGLRIVNLCRGGKMAEVLISLWFDGTPEGSTG